MPTVLLWIVLLWAGWVLLFASNPDALSSTSSPAVADLSGPELVRRLHDVHGGNGDFTPDDDVWQVSPDWSP